MLQPKRTKFRKQHKGRIHGEAKGGFELELRHLRAESDRARADHRAADRSRPSCHDASHEASGLASGSGSSRIRRSPRSPPKFGWVRVRARSISGPRKVKPGRIMFEIDGVNEVVAREALRLAAMKLPIKTRTIVREDW